MIKSSPININQNCIKQKFFILSQSITNQFIELLIIVNLKAQIATLNFIMITQQLNSIQFNQPKAKSIPKPIARSASLQRFSNTNKIHNNQKQVPQNQGIQMVSMKQNLSRALRDKLNPFNNINKANCQNQKQPTKNRNLIVNKLMQKGIRQIQCQSQKGQAQRNNPINKQRNSSKQISSSNTSQLEGFYHKHQNIQKLLSLKEQKQQNQLKECTFNPKTNVRTNNLMQKKHDINHFYQQQAQFEKRKNNKIQQMRQIIQKSKNKENIFHPQITHRESSKNKDEVYQRLYQKSKFTTQEQNSECKSVAFLRGESCRNGSNPKRNNSTNKIKSIMSKNQVVTRSNNVKCFSQMNILIQGQTQQAKPQSYQYRPNSVRKVTQLQHSKDTTSNKQENSSSSQAILKRIQSAKKLDCQQLLRKNKINQEERIKQQRNVSIHKNRNEQIFLTKFLKQSIQIVIKTNLRYHLNYMELSSFLQNLNFVDKNSASNQRTYVSQIWRLLNGHTYNFVSILNILKVLCCIQGATKPRIIDQLIDLYLIQSSVNQIKQIIPDKIQNILVLQQSDTKVIKQRFKDLGFNKLRLGQSFLLKETAKQQYSFKPLISQLSNQLAERYRQRILHQSQELISQHKIDFNVPQAGLINHTQLLLLDEKRRIHKLQQMRLEKQKQQHIFQQLSMTQHLSSILKTERSQRSKNTESCFEQPCSIQSRKKRNKQSLNSQQASLRKHQISTNLNCYNQNHFKENVYKNDQRQKSYHRCPQNQPNTTPLLYLNVNMEGNQNTRIPVFNSDTLKTMTQKVRVIMKIQDGEEQRKKLSQILKAQIQPILAKMGLENSIKQFD